MREANTSTKEYEIVAQQLYDSYSTPQSESLLAALLQKTQGIPSNALNRDCTAREYLNEFVLRYYPNEMAIKSNFVDNVLLKQGHSNISIFELPVGNSRVDLCKINGCSSAYEIKTDLDSFYRLEKQLADYFEVFENVYVIASDKRCKMLPDYVPKNCGIYSYRQRQDGRYSFTLKRAPVQNRKLNPLKQLTIIPKSVIGTAFDLSNNLAKSAMISECLLRNSVDNINRFFKRYLKARYGKRWDYFKTINPSILEIDYEWFFHNNLDPTIVY